MAMKSRARYVGWIPVDAGRTRLRAAFSASSTERHGAKRFATRWRCFLFFGSPRSRPPPSGGLMGGSVFVLLSLYSVLSPQVSPAIGSQSVRKSSAFSTQFSEVLDSIESGFSRFMFARFTSARRTQREVIENVALGDAGSPLTVTSAASYCRSCRMAVSVSAASSPSGLPSSLAVPVSVGLDSIHIVQHSSSQIPRVAAEQRRSFGSLIHSLPWNGM